MKKIGVAFGLMLIASIFMTGFASATFADSLDDFFESSSDVIGLLLGGVDDWNMSTGTSTGEIFLIKLLVFFLLFIILNYAVKKVPQVGEKGFLPFGIALIVSILAVRFITNESLVQFIWLPYGVIGVVLSSLLPFGIAFFFLESFDSSTIRKVGWAMFFLLFAALALLRWDAFATESLGGTEFNLGWVYIGVAIISLALIIYDRQIHAWRFRANLKNVSDRGKRIAAIDLNDEIKELQRKLGSAGSDAARTTIKTELDDKKKALQDLLK